jgi:uncharacterized protein YcbK (DUF882 family)/LysM repeat protein
MLPLAAVLVFADVNHVVAHGHTIEAIAHRYHVSVKAIVDANHLKDTKHLKPGQVLVIPGVDGHGAPGPKKGAHGDKAEKAEKAEGADKRDHGDHEEGSGPHGDGARAHSATASLTPAPEPHGRAGGMDKAGGGGDTLHAIRLTEEFRIRTKDSHGRIPASAIGAFERMMRQGNATHPVDPRLVALVGIVSAHFGDKPIEVVSGFRAYTPTQYTPHSNHNLGRALDFRVRGVKNEDLWAFCRTLRAAGCGYYPNSTFVHLDVRETKAFWIDRSRPGEPPQYDSPDAAADETASDVPGDSQEGETPAPAAGSPVTPATTPSEIQQNPPLEPSPQ